MWWLVKFSIVLQCVYSVRIINMEVPDVIQYGTTDTVTLDCDFVTDNVTGLVVKWFYMDKTQPVYQWIPPQKPQALGILNDKVDLSYTVSDNPYTQHRALRITSLKPELTGNYTCVVSTFLAEDEQTKPMAIFVTEKRFTMLAAPTEHDCVNIICFVEAIYPKPELVILIGNRQINAKSAVIMLEERYSAATTIIMKTDALPSTVEIMCDLQVPLAKYHMRRRRIFYKDPPSSIDASELGVPDAGYHTSCSKIAVLISILLNLLRIHPTH